MDVQKSKGRRVQGFVCLSVVHKYTRIYTRGTLPPQPPLLSSPLPSSLMGCKPQEGGEGGEEGDDEEEGCYDVILLSPAATKHTPSEASLLLIGPHRCGGRCGLGLGLKAKPVVVFRRISAAGTKYRPRFFSPELSPANTPRRRRPAAGAGEEEGRGGDPWSCYRCRC